MQPTYCFMCIRSVVMSKTKKKINFRIPDPHSSELVAYIKKLLHSGIGKENANMLRTNDNNDDVDVGAKNGNVRSGIPTIGSSIPRYIFV